MKTKQLIYRNLRIAGLVLLALFAMASMSCEKKQKCDHWTMVVEDQQMKLDDATLNFTYNPSEENLSKIKNAKQNLVLSKRNKEQYCN